ncbi:MAG: hypothetical protein ACYTFV_17870 [Planctomycetota bacterium]|jgi:hypothetical protein
MSTSPIGTYVSQFLLTALTMGAALAAQKEQQVSGSGDTETITATVYADNWYVVTFELKAEYPMTIAIRAEDNADPRTGMEYDDTQIGDGGFALRLSDGTISDASWRAQCFSRGPVGGDVQNPSVAPSSLLSSRSTRRRASSSTTSVPLASYGARTWRSTTPSFSGLESRRRGRRAERGALPQLHRRATQRDG